MKLAVQLSVVKSHCWLTQPLSAKLRKAGTPKQVLLRKIRKETHYLTRARSSTVFQGKKWALSYSGALWNNEF